MHLYYIRFMNNSSNSPAPIESRRREAPPPKALPGRLARYRRSTGLIGGGLSVVFLAWLPLGILGIVPFALQIPGESLLRTHAGAAVTCLMVTAWAYWET